MPYDNPFWRDFTEQRSFLKPTTSLVVIDIDGLNGCPSPDFKIFVAAL